ncbi:MAG TPA: hypothetical protein VI911_07585 [Patescibacteria group bacterium]|nr:hypothetical protein [Patescibacteria group bacterium]
MNYIFNLLAGIQLKKYLVTEDMANKIESDLKGLRYGQAREIVFTTKGGISYKINTKDYMDFYLVQTNRTQPEHNDLRNLLY